MSLLLNTFFDLKFNSKVKIDPKTCNVKNLEKIFQKHLETLLKLFFLTLN